MNGVNGMNVNGVNGVNGRRVRERCVNGSGVCNRLIPKLHILFRSLVHTVHTSMYRDREGVPYDSPEGEGMGLPHDHAKGSVTKIFLRG